MTGPAAPSAADLRAWGLDPAWSRTVDVAVPGAPPVRWHVLDTGPGPRGTVVCVHGNPTWGYLWRDLLERLAPGWRVIAVDQTGMGFSERPGPRRLEQRVAELVAFCRQEVDGPLVLAAHDWGGPVAVGATADLQVSALVLANTAVARPDGVAVPPLIAAARRLVGTACRRTPAFVAGAAAMTAPAHRRALRAPYRGAARRTAVADFVADIPLRPADPAWAALARSADALERFTAPVLLAWGGRDPVFHDRFLADLVRRVPHAEVHRVPEAGHLLPLDVELGAMVDTWLDQRLGVTAAGERPGPGGRHAGPVEPDRPAASVAQTPGPGPEPPFRPVTAAVVERAGDTGPAYSGPDGTISWAQLAERTGRAARHLRAAGLGRGDRVALLVPPGLDLLVAAYGVWRAGGTIVVADAGLGPRGLRRALRGATPDWVIGTRRTHAAARLLGLTPGARRAGFGRFTGELDLGARWRGDDPAPVVPLPDIDPADVAAIVHTSGATGPAKPVRYRHRALAVQRDLVARSFAMGPEEAFTTSFAPFVLLGPALGVPCVLPDIDVTDPAQLDLDRLRDACARGPVGVAWLSPASARSLVASAAGRRVPLRLVMLAGAPIDAELARAIGEITGAEVRSPYGMTEAMPVTDGVAPTAAGPLGGTATGRVLDGATALVVPLGRPGDPPLGPEQWGELLVTAPWMFDGYDRSWATQEHATVRRGEARFHRTGDVAYATADGTLFQLGRARHVIAAAAGAVPSVSVEQPVAAAVGLPVAAVGVGPAGSAVVVVVVDDDRRRPALADPQLTAQVRAAAPVPVAAVLRGRLPVDVRHRSKVDREALAAQAATFLAGR